MHTRPVPHTPALALFLLVLCLSPLGGCAGGGGADPYSKRYTARDINPNPHILNSAIVKGTNLSGLRLENLMVKDATFYSTTAQGVYLKNVIFDNCRFIDAKFDEAVLENVTFRGGILTCEGDAYNFARGSQFTNARFTNLVIDGAYLENALFNGSDGSVYIRNTHHIIATHPVVTGSDIRLVLQNSVFRNMTIAEVTGKSTLTAEGCIFEYAYFGNSTFFETALSKNITYGNNPVPENPRVSRRRAR